ncbi:MAG: hypothetical protein P8K27_02880 [Gammaproteobacteria bacterium]|nr:hypothetical protein [Gammaproteobacteria bacterium]
MSKLITLIGAAFLLSGCESLYEANDDGIPTIRSQRDVDVYNETVSSESEKLVCERETVIGSNIRQWVCLTVAQRDYLARQAQEDIENIRQITPSR